MKKPIFVNNQIYHIYNRGTDKRKIFLDKYDYFQFIHDLFEFNDQQPALNRYYQQPYEVQPRKVAGKVRRKRRLLVEILAFCLMPNHFHLLLRQKTDNGIPKFMQKLGTGYSMYFNRKYQRAGSLFESRYKAIHINNQSHFIYIPYYIHLNPLDLIAPEWRERKIKNYKRTIDFLNSYRWSSYLDYIGKNNFPSATSREFFLEFFDGSKEYQKSTENWLKDLTGLDSIKPFILE